MVGKQTALLSGVVLLMLANAGHAQVSQADLHREADIRSDMVKFNPHYNELVAPRRKKLNALTAEIEARESSGEKVTCSHQIAIETRWLLGYTADFPRIDQRLSDLKDSLAHPDRESRAEQEDPHDGSWGGCYTEWFERLDASYDFLQMEKAQGIAPKYRFSLLDRINSPEKLRDYFASITTSDVARTGVDHRKELNAAFVDLIRVIMAGDPANYHWDPRLKQELLNLTFNQYRNQQTGWWGETYIHNNQREYVDDLSITFHIVVALEDDVPLKRKVATTLFALQNVSYPAGWTENLSNHDNMDVIVLMRATWSDMTPEQRKKGAAVINSMLHWCLNESLQPDGSFTPSPEGDDSIEEGEHFGVAFLSRIGYFDKSRRFWTNQDFPESDANRQRIIHFIRAHQNSGAAGGAYYSSALQEITN